jgi:hypothetical protein
VLGCCGCGASGLYGHQLREQPGAAVDRGLGLQLAIHKLARSGTIKVSCAGRRCPFKVQRSDGRHVTRFVKAIERRVFHTGQELTITVAQPHLTSERFRITIRRNAKPAVRVL